MGEGEDTFLGGAKRSAWSLQYTLAHSDVVRNMENLLKDHVPDSGLVIGVLENRANNWALTSKARVGRGTPQGSWSGSRHN